MNSDSRRNHDSAGRRDGDGESASQRVGEESHVDVSRRAMLAILTVMSAEQFAQLAQALVVTRDNAIIRQCGQAVEIEFNDKGFPRYIHYSQSVKMVKAE